MPMQSSASSTEPTVRWCQLEPVISWQSPSLSTALRWQSNLLVSTQNSSRAINWPLKVGGRGGGEVFPIDLDRLKYLLGVTKAVQECPLHVEAPLVVLLRCWRPPLRGRTRTCTPYTSCHCLASHRSMRQFRKIGSKITAENKRSAMRENTCSYPRAASIDNGCDETVSSENLSSKASS